MTTIEAEMNAIEQVDEDTPERETCGECHGEGEFVCINGCHTRECWSCDGEGYV